MLPLKLESTGESTPPWSRNDFEPGKGSSFDCRLERGACSFDRWGVHARAGFPGCRRRTWDPYCDALSHISALRAAATPRRRVCLTSPTSLGCATSRLIQEGTDELASEALTTVQGESSCSCTGSPTSSSPSGRRRAPSISRSRRIHQPAAAVWYWWLNATARRDRRLPVAVF